LQVRKKGKRSMPSEHKLILEKTEIRKNIVSMESSKKEEENLQKIF